MCQPSSLLMVWDKSKWKSSGFTPKGKFLLETPQNLEVRKCWHTVYDFTAGMPQCESTEPQNPRLIWIGRDFKPHPIPPPGTPSLFQGSSNLPLCKDCVGSLLHSPPSKELCCSFSQPKPFSIRRNLLGAFPCNEKPSLRCGWEMKAPKALVC